jgi:hypothetical protein
MPTRVACCNRAAALTAIGFIAQSAHTRSPVRIFIDGYDRAVGQISDRWTNLRGTAAADIVTPDGNATPSPIRCRISHRVRRAARALRRRVRAAPSTRKTFWMAVQQAPR